MNRSFFSGILPRLVLVTLFAAAACKKIKTDPNHASAANLLNIASSIKLFNLSGSQAEIEINNIFLTNFKGESINTQTGLALFPSGYWEYTDDGNPFSIPRNLLDKGGNAHVIISTGGFSVDTLLYDDGLHPTDYFLVSDGTRTYLQSSPRETIPPTRPDAFRVRVINLTSSGNSPVPVTVTFANGTPVDSVFTNVMPNTISPYLELPYGAYQFRLFENNIINGDNNLTDPSRNPVTGQYFYFIDKINFFKPGGAYSIYVHQIVYTYVDPSTNNVIPFYKNAFNIINQLSPPVNTSHVRLLNLNALPLEKVQFKVDGVPLNATLDFGSYSDYNTLVTGTHLVAAYDRFDNLLVQKSYTFEQADNIMAAVYEKDGKPDLSFTPNDLSGINYDMKLRFLNFSADVPLITFGVNDGPMTFTSDTATYQNIAQGEGSVTDPYVLLDPNANTGNGNMYFFVFQSDYGVVPGQELIYTNRTYLRNFIANPAMYTSQLPFEAGMYSLALIGKYNSPVSAPEHAKLIIIKYNK